MCGIAGYVSAGKLEVTGCTLGTVGNYKVTDSNSKDAAPGLLFGVLDAWKNIKSIEGSTITPATFDKGYDKNEWNDTGANTVVNVTSCVGTGNTTENIGWRPDTTKTDIVHPVVK